MSPLTPQEQSVARYYDGSIFEAELIRLPDDFPVELAMTSRYLERWIPAGSIVAEVGVGGGHYTRLLASRDCRLHLVDISQRLLDAVATKLDAAGLAQQIFGTHCASATRLDPLESNTFDAVLFLGPLYHLGRLEERQQAVAEAARILKAGGLLFAAGINRLTYLRDLFRDSPDQAVPRRDFHARFLQDGLLDPTHAPPIGFAHLTSVKAFRGLFEPLFEQSVLLAVESFVGGASQQKFKELPPEDQSAWLDLIERTASFPEAFGIADHYMYIGRKK
ncbi:MAG: methyltransferase domain-containing protein [Acidobacteria bacterium]|nr:methyltransferase domain-containing protein [Acidobacteriota bacterium]